jgi:EAL domain-containing protein (putative c-di-GMP-specific phosphodiesterase class I)
VHVTTSEKTDAVRRLLAVDGICTVFQPIWDLRSNTLLGVEALTRPDPHYDLMGPAEVFDVAEQIGCVRALDMLCVEHALQITPELCDGVLLFMNLSPQTLDLDSDGDDWLRTAVQRAGLAPANVVIEVTERLGGRTAAVTATVRRLRSQGFKIAIDDVGTGNSGLEMLRSVDAEYVKIDRSIVVAAATEPGSRAVLKAMATYAHETGSFVIAEGIEDRDTLDFLRAIDDRDAQLARIIHGGQGFGLGRPGPHVPRELPRLLRETATPRF